MKFQSVEGTHRCRNNKQYYYKIKSGQRFRLEWMLQRKRLTPFNRKCYFNVPVLTRLQFSKHSQVFISNDELREEILNRMSWFYVLINRIFNLATIVISHRSRHPADLILNTFIRRRRRYGDSGHECQCDYQFSQRNVEHLECSVNCSHTVLHTVLQMIPIVIVTNVCYSTNFGLWFFSGVRGLLKKCNRMLIMA